MGDAFFSYRVLGWRPIGASPIAKPDYATRRALTGHELDESGFLGEFRGNVASVEFCPRYDGFYVADITFTEHQVEVLSKDAGPVAENLYLLENIATRVDMLIKNHLGHQHYFHAVEQKKMKPAAWWTRFVLAISFTIATLTYAILNTRFEAAWHVGLFVLFAVSVIGVITLIQFYRVVMPPIHALSPNGVLVPAPVIVGVSGPEGKLQEDLGSVVRRGERWLAHVKTLQSSTSWRERQALVQLRRGFLRIAERVSSIVIDRKVSDTRWRPAVVGFFWAGIIFFATGLVVTGLLSAGSYIVDPNERSENWQIVFGAVPEIWFALVGLATVFFGVTGLVFVLSILNQDLPKVKLLRTTQGFLSSANQINISIENILRHDVMKSERRRVRRNQKIERRNQASIDDFSDLIRSFDIKVAGESQRLQIKQFWAASCAAMFAALVTAMTIVMQPDKDPPTEATGGSNIKVQQTSFGSS